MTHDQIIWLGDLNYDATDENTWALVDQGAWECLLQKDQLQLEQRAGHVFEGWHENPICFPPTYKFIINSDQYFGRDTHHLVPSDAHLPGKLKSQSLTTKYMTIVAMGRRDIAAR